MNIHFNCNIWNGIPMHQVRNVPLNQELIFVDTDNSQSRIYQYNDSDHAFVTILEVGGLNHHVLLKIWEELGLNYSGEIFVPSHIDINISENLHQKQMMIDRTLNFMWRLFLESNDDRKNLICSLLRITCLPRTIITRKSRLFISDKILADVINDLKVNYQFVKDHDIAQSILILKENLPEITSNQQNKQTFIKCVKNIWCTYLNPRLLASLNINIKL